jgi:hypothetical protein
MRCLRRKSGITTECLTKNVGRGWKNYMGLAVVTGDSINQQIGGGESQSNKLHHRVGNKLDSLKSNP